MLPYRGNLYGHNRTSYNSNDDDDDDDDNNTNVHNKPDAKP